MFLFKIVLSCFFALLIGGVGAEVSFDMENYANYVDNPVAAIERFATEPVFPLFVLALGSLELPSMVVVQAFMTLASFIIVFAVTALANNGRDFGLIRSLLALFIVSPFIMFSVIVPRQGLAVGLVLSAVARLQMKRGELDWTAIALLSFSVITHGATSVLGVLVIFAGYVRLRLLLSAISVVIPVALLLLIIFSPELVGFNYIAYANYIGDFRDTGVFRLWYFVAVVLVYLSLISWRKGGFFARSATRNLFVVLTFTIGIVFLYFSVTTDAVRLVYPIGIVMVSEMVNRVSILGRMSLMGGGAWPFPGKI